MTAVCGVSVSINSDALYFAAGRFHTPRIWSSLDRYEIYRSSKII